MANAPEQHANAAEIHRTVLKAVQDKDIKRLRSMLSPNYSYTGTDGTVTKGPDAGLAIAEKYNRAFPDLEFKVTNQHDVSPTLSVIEFIARGTHKGELEGIAATGRKAEVVVCNIIETLNGKVVRERDYFDTMSLMRQLGVITS